MKSTRAVLVGSFIGPSRGALGALKATLAELKLRKADLVVGIDGGVDHCLRAGRRPDLAVGDWDSIRDRRVLEGLPHLTLARQKSRSDLYYAAVSAIALGARDLVFTGASGGRPDQALGVLLDLADLAATGEVRSLSLVGPDCQYVFLSAGIPLWRGRLPRGQTLSVFALAGRARGVTLTGMEYALRDATLRPGSQGLSNRVTSRVCEVRIKVGSLVIMIPKLGRRPS